MDQRHEVEVDEEGRRRLRLAIAPLTETSDRFTLDAVIYPDGSLVLEDWAYGPRTEATMGNDEVEAVLKTLPEDKDRILLLLVREFLSQDRVSIHRFKDWLRANGIPCEFGVW